MHACLYFITPNGHGLKSIDLVCMKKLDSKVNIIPIIAKADTINKAELSKFKTKIMAELSNNGVQIYQFPTGKTVHCGLRGYEICSAKRTILPGNYRIYIVKRPFSATSQISSQGFSMMAICLLQYLFNYLTSK